MRISKWIRPLRFLIVLCVVNMLLSFFLEPVRGASDTMWAEYYQEEEIDFAFVGASFCSATFAPYIVDEIMEVKSFNMGTPLQAMGQTVSAVETLIKDHEVDTIVLGTGFFVLQYETLDEAELTFEKARARRRTGLSTIEDALDYIFDEDVRGTEKSINYFFPWVYNHETITREYIWENVSAKIEQMKIKFSENDDGKEEKRKGFRPYEGIVDYSQKWQMNSFLYYDQSFLEEKVQEFEELLQICIANDVDIIVINTPHPAYDLVACYSTYEQSENEMKAICEKYTVDYYNFSLAKPELFELKEEYIYDFEHLNKQGAEVFSESLCELLELRTHGDSLKDYFYSVDEFFELHDDLLEEMMSL